VLYERLIDTGDEKPELLGNEGFIEHDVADELIAKLGRARNKGDVKWTAGIKVLTDIIEHHIEEEEKEVFKETRRNFKAAQLNEMEEEFEKVKAKVRG
jgi:hemerythrin-like domain-containing protein